MKRDLTQLTHNQFDIVIIGGGIYGVCAARDAALRGLTVALIEKGDFGSATSSNSLKIIHGGLRYLQHADFRRMRESITERRTLMRIAPHLVHPLPCIMPTYGHSLKGKEVMALALLINDLVGFDRNREIDPARSLPNGRVISRDECRELIPGIDANGLSGGALWYDCQVHNAERMLISILKSAVAAGGVAANYVEMTGFQKHGDRITGIRARDVLTGDEFDIQGKLVINNSGPWINTILQHLNGHYSGSLTELSAAMNVVVKRQLIREYAVGIWSKAEFKDDDAVLSKGSRLFFITPWREFSLIGTTHVPYEGDPEYFRVREKDIMAFLQEVNDAYPRANLTPDDVYYFYGGMLPSEGHNEKTGDVKLRKHYDIIDHKERDGLDGLISVIGVKYTTARDVGQKTIDFAAQKLGLDVSVSRTAVTPICGGNIENFEHFLRGEKTKAPAGLGEDSIKHLIHNYGTEYTRVIQHGSKDREGLQPLAAETPVIKAEVIHAIQEEMAVKLADVVRRRTDLGTAGPAGEQSLQACADLMAQELGWDQQRMQNEMEETRALYIPSK